MKETTRITPTGSLQYNQNKIIFFALNNPDTAPPSQVLYRATNNPTNAVKIGVKKKIHSWLESGFELKGPLLIRPVTTKFKSLNAL